MQVPVSLIKQQPLQAFLLWDREMLVQVHRHCGAHGFASSVIVVERIDSPLEAITYNGYGFHKPKMEHAEPAMDKWIAEELTKLSQGKQLATGTECEVVPFDI